MMTKTKTSARSRPKGQHAGLVGVVYGALPAAGESGFENLVAHQLSRVTGSTFRLAKSGRQFGIDALSSHATTIAVQCKRYGKTNALNLVALQAELLESLGTTRSLDAWVLATTQVLAANDAGTLRQFAENFGVEFVAIDSSGPWPSDLDILLAADLPILRSHFATYKKAKVAVVDELAREVRTAPSFNLRLGKLRKRLSDAKVGYDHWRRRSHALLRDGFNNDHQSTKLFHQNLNLAHAKSKTVRRATIHADLDTWWESQQKVAVGVQRPFLAITGEEGDGKTWALANWLDERIGSSQSDFPSVVWLPSKDVSNADLLSCLKGHVSRAYGTEPERARKQLDRWLSAIDSPSPQCLLVIDGLNESPRTSLWRTLLAEFVSLSPQLAISLIVTTRKGYWEEHIPLDSRFPPRVISVTSFSDVEFAEALQKSGLRSTDFPTEINDLVRKPRYFELAVRFQDEITRTGGTITRARLVYEDIKARYSNKVGYPISHEKFQEHLVKLAKLHKDHLGRFDSQHVGSIARFDDHDAVVTELTTGGIFHCEGVSYVFNDDQLPHAMGLLVGDELCNATGAINPEEQLAKWMEPEAAIDLKAKVLEYALLYSAFRKPAASRDVQCALLGAWNDHQNRLAQYADNFDAYITLMPGAYIRFAEQLAESDRLNSDVERSLLVAFVNGLNVSKVSAVLESAIDRWCSYLHPAGDPYQNDDKEEMPIKRVAEAERLAGKPLVGPEVRIGKFVLLITANPQNLHLGRFSLCVISHVDKRRFLPSITKLTLAEAIMEPSRRIDEAAWAVFYTETSLTQLVEENADALLETASEGAGIAAGWLLKWEGSRINYEKYLQLPAKFRPDPWARHAKLFKDECLDFFHRWTGDVCRRCMERDDVPIHILWQELKHQSLNPAFRANKKAIFRLTTALAKLDPTTIWSMFGRTKEDHDLEEISKVLGRFAPKALGGYLRQVFASGAARQGMALRQISWRVPPHELVLNRTTREHLRIAWVAAGKNTATLPEGDRSWVEAYLFFGWLPIASAEKQLKALIHRPDAKRADLRLLESCFKPTNRAHSLEALGALQNATQTTRTLWFLSRFPKAHSLAVLELVAQHLRSPISFVRSLALKILVLNKTVHARELFLRNDWHWPGVFKDHDEEIYWGSMGWRAWGKERALDHLLTRVHPCYLGGVILSRGSKKVEIAQFLRLVLTGWNSLAQYVATGAHSVPQVNVELPHEFDELRLVRYRAQSSGERDLMSLLAESAKTNASKERTINFEELANRAFDERQVIESAAIDAREHAKQLCQLWFGDGFTTEAVDLIVQHDRKLVDEWVAAVGEDTGRGTTTVFHSGELYLSLLRILLQREDSRAPVLYRNLNRTSRAMRTVHADSRLNIADEALFSTRANGGEVVELWNEHLSCAASDHDLLVLAVLANKGPSKAWLKARTRALIKSAIAYERAIGITLLGFLEDSQAEDVLRRLRQDTQHINEKTLIDTAIERQQKHAWALHWLNRYWNCRDPDVAHGALILFEGCATSRVWGELHRLIFRAKEVHPHRQRVLDNRRDNFARSIEENEKELTKRYLLRSKHSELMAPWSRALFE